MNHTILCKGKAMKRALLILGLLLCAMPAQAQLTDRSATVTTTAATIIPAAGAQRRSFILLYNHGSVTVYCRWGTTAVAAAAGTWGLIGPGGNMILTNPQVIPGDLLSCITASSTAVLTAQTIP